MAFLKVAWGGSVEWMSSPENLRGVSPNRSIVTSAIVIPFRGRWFEGISVAISDYDARSDRWQWYGVVNGG